jgi:hypothetical protein
MGNLILLTKRPGGEAKSPDPVCPWGHKGAPLFGQPFVLRGGQNVGSRSEIHRRVFDAPFPHPSPPFKY